MPFNRPTLTALADQSRADFSDRLPGADSRLRRSVLDVLARTHAGGLHGAYGNLDWIADQMLPDTASTEVLERWATTFGVNRQAATAASGLANATGVNGSAILAGTRLQRADAVEYEVTANAVIAGGVVALSIEAVEAGTSALASAGTPLTFVSPIAGVAATAVVAMDGIGTGTDEESNDSLLARLLERLRDPPAGGKASDYVKWAKLAPGEKDVWVYPLKNGLGTVGVTFIMSDRDDIIPEAGDLAAVTAAIEANRPVTADVEVFAPVADPLDFAITLTPDTPAVRAAVAAELADLLRRDRAPAGTILISRIREAVSIAAGETDNVVTSPTANVVSPAGHIPVMGDITW